jgi:polyhydroxyalkanoate synthase subunit PhaC
MNKPTKPIHPTHRKQVSAKAATDGLQGKDTILSPGAADALLDIAKRAERLFRLQVERLASEDGYQVIDPRTVAATLQEFARTAQSDPTRVVDGYFRLWTDVGLLWQKTATRFLFHTAVEPVISPSPQDKRFKNELWTEDPLCDYIKQLYLLMSRYLETSLNDVTGVDPHTLQKQKFYTRQFLSALSPANFAVTNPIVLKATIESRGENLIKGFRNLIEDLERGGGRLSLKMSDLSAFRFGDNIAISPGKVARIQLASA